jgi:LysR family transcriptional regulator, regulator of abg operon
LKLNQLRVFLTVAEQGGLHAAARALRLSQPAITVTIRELEKQLGVPLIVRSVNGVKLTEYGVVFEQRARQLVGDMLRTQDELHAMRERTGGNVSMAVSSVVAGTLIPPAFAEFRAQTPDASVAFREMPMPVAFNALRDGQTDFAVLNYMPGVRFPDFLEHEDILTMPIHPVVRQGHPLARVRTLARLLDAEWLLPSDPGDDIDRLFPQFFKEQGLTPPTRILRCQSLLPTMMLLKTTDLIGIATESTLKLEMRHHGISAIRVPEGFPETIIATVVRRGHPLTSAAQAFLDCIKGAARAWMRSQTGRK